MDRTVALWQKAVETRNEEIECLRSEIDQLWTEKIALTAEVERLRALIVKHQWAGSTIQNGEVLAYCPECDAIADRHAPYCEIGIEAAKAAKEKP